jgi:hypothetical protein
MSDLSIDQKPEGWDPVAKAYGLSFASLTALFAQDALRLVNVQPGQRILDVAAGTGALSLAAAEAGAIVSVLKELVPDFPAPKKPAPVLSLADRNTFKCEMQAGGFAYVNMFTVAHIWTFSSPGVVLNSLDSAAPPMARIFSKLAPNQREAFRRALHRKIEGEQREGPFGLEGKAHIAVGVK